jgi:large subunit ribosomal protein L20
MSNKSRRNLLARTKGFRNARKNKRGAAHEAIVHAGNHAFAHRKSKKRDFRALWTLRINAAVRALGMGSYSRFINSLKVKEIGLDRKILSTLAKDHPEIFARVTKQI